MGESQYITQDRYDKHNADVSKKLDLIYRGLFIDNGKPCHQTRIDRHDRMLSLMAWISGVLCVAVVIQVVGFIFSKLVK